MSTVERCILLSGGTQSCLAKKLNISQKSISKFKSEGCFPPKHYPRLLELFDHSLTEQELLYDFYQAQKKKQNKQKTK
ncbi:helix-turn-helix domain-containing protein [Pleionea sediminis]|uniref:helix-turn-helix domain-containing protein n=1 Tax=Pleionea sediminis TaxID=2569479 RepID=UPI001186A152|nr:helix-turn-helix domain-containing protein [Pleionea sediminis]